MPTLLEHFDEVNVWLQALHQSASRCGAEATQRILSEALPMSEVERTRTFVKAIKPLGMAV